MKIFLAFLQAQKKHDLPSYRFWEYYIKKGIEEAGHEWVECIDADWAEGLTLNDETVFTNWKTSTWEKTLQSINSQKPDLFLGYLFPKQVDADVVREIQKTGIPCVNFFCDNVREFSQIPKEFSVFDLHWVPEHAATKMYQKAGLKYLHLPMPMWVDPQYRSPSEIEDRRIAFIGSYDIQRLMLFEEVIKYEELDLRIYGEGWLNRETVSEKFSPSNSSVLINQLRFIKELGIAAYLRKLQQRQNRYEISAQLKLHLSGKPDFEHYITLTRESMITLGVNRFPDFKYPLKQPHTYSRLRDIEAPMLGACYVTEWAEGLDEMYDLDREIRTYKSAEELVEKCRMLTHAQERKNMRRLGQVRALNEHSVPKSLMKIESALFR